jgi:nucleoid DNA-binding protein
MATGFKELVLLPALRKQGLMEKRLTRDEAKAVIIAVFGSIKDALLRHESVELPIGTFTMVQNPKRAGWKFGQVVIFPKYRIKFLPSAALKLAAAAAPPSPPSPKRKKKPVIKTELTISTELISGFIRANVYDRNLFFNELQNGPSVRAMFNHVQPKPHEFRTLDEAAHVIKECKPPQMPDDPWDHPYACLEWFARWTQRVIPPAVWQEAMKEAKKTLVPKS